MFQGFNAPRFSVSAGDEVEVVPEGLLGPLRRSGCTATVLRAVPLQTQDRVSLGSTRPCVARREGSAVSSSQRQRSRSLLALTYRTRFVHGSVSHRAGRLPLDPSCAVGLTHPASLAEHPVGSVGPSGSVPRFRSPSLLVRHDAPYPARLSGQSCRPSPPLKPLPTGRRPTACFHPLLC